MRRKSQYDNESLAPVYVDPFSIWGTKKKIPDARAMESYNNWCYACIRAIAEEIAAMKILVKGIGTDEVKDEHEILDILAAPNSLLTGYNLFFKTCAHLELCGNAYWLLSGVKDEFGQPTSITLLNPGTVKMLINEGVFPNQLQGYTYRQKTTDYHFKPFEVLHFEYPDPADDFSGVGTVQSIAKWVDADNYAMEVNRRFFLNGARIGGFLESDSARTPEQLDYLKKSFDAIFKGVDSSYQTAALPKGVKFTEAAKTPKDMDFSQLSNEMQKRILGGFRVPKSVLGVTEDVNRANAEASNYIFALRTIKPKMDQIIGTLNAFFVPRFGKDIYLDYKDPVPENTDLKIKEMQTVVGNKPIKTQNEVRAEYYGLDPVDGGDSIEPTKQPAPGGNGNEPPPAKGIVKQLSSAKEKIVKPIAKAAMSIYHRTLKRRQKLSDDFADNVIKVFNENKEKAEQIRKKGIKDVINSDWEVLWKDFVGRVGKYEDQVREAMRGFNNKQCAEVLESLQSIIGKSYKKKAIDPAALFDKTNAIKMTIDLLTPIITATQKDEGEKAGALIGFPGMDITQQENVKNAIDKRVNLMAESYDDTTRAALAQTIDDGLTKGASLDDISKAVGELYDGWNDTRAGMVARTETFAAANSATKEAWKQTGVVKTIKWYTAADEQVCEWCSEMSDKEIAIEDNFYDKGDEMTVDGQTMSFDYDTVGGPPLHANCRCFLKPAEISIED